MSMTRKEHIERHKLLHKHLDELLADFLTHNGHCDPPKYPSNTTVMELIQWSYTQTTNPDELGVIA